MCSVEFTGTKGQYTKVFNFGKPKPSFKLSRCYMCDTKLARDAHLSACKSTCKTAGGQWIGIKGDVHRCQAWEVEHVIALKDKTEPGGERKKGNKHNVMGNLLPACLRCNRIKKDDGIASLVQNQKLSVVDWINRERGSHLRKQTVERLNNALRARFKTE